MAAPLQMAAEASSPIGLGQRPCVPLALQLALPLPLAPLARGATQYQPTASSCSQASSGLPYRALI